MDNWRRFRLGGNSGGGTGLKEPTELDVSNASSSSDDKVQPILGDDFLWGLENVSSLAIVTDSSLATHATATRSSKPYTRRNHSELLLRRTRECRSHTML